MSRVRSLMIAAGAAALLAGGPALTQQMPDLPPQPPELPPIPPQPEAGSPITVYPVRGGLYMVTGPTGNTAVSIGYDGVLVVDPGSADAAKALLAWIRTKTSRPVHFIVDTNGDLDHIAANHAVAMAGELLEGGNTRPEEAVGGTGGAPIWAHEGVLNRVSAAGGEPTGWPSDTYFVEQKDMFVNGEPVQLLHAPAAHTDGDSLVFFRRSDVLVTGDVYTPDRYPVIDLEHGGSVNGLIDGLNRILRITVPEFNEEGGTFVIPGHGRLSDEADVSEYRDMVTIVRDRIKAMIDKKMSLQQIQAARPTLDYDVRYGEDAGRTFVEQVYRSLTQKAETRR